MPVTNLIRAGFSDSRSRRCSWLLAMGALILGITIQASAANASGPPGRMHGFNHSRSHHREAQTCNGTIETPGTLTGVYDGDVSVEGVCLINAGEAVVRGDLTLRPDSALLGAFALNDTTGSGSSNLTVRGDLKVENGSAALLGCEPTYFQCLDDSSPAPGTLTSEDHIYGNVWENEPLGVVMHKSVIGGDITEVGGGGGVTCVPSGPFALFGVPVYSDYEDLAVHGDLTVAGLQSCWLGMARDQVHGDVNAINDQLADPDAIEILANEIHGDLVCLGNSQVWDNADETEASLYPRLSEPNTVHGRRIGQCVLASPETEGGPLGPGPF